MEIAEVNEKVELINTGVQNPEILLKTIDKDTLLLSNYVKVNGKTVQSYIVEFLTRKFESLDVKFKEQGRIIEVYLPRLKSSSSFTMRDLILSVNLSEKTYSLCNSCIHWYEYEMEERIQEKQELSSYYKRFEDLSISGRYRIIKNRWKETGIKLSVKIRDTFYVIFHAQDIEKAVAKEKQRIKDKNEQIEQSRIRRDEARKYNPEQINEIKSVQTELSKYFNQIGYKRISETD